MCCLHRHSSRPNSPQQDCSNNSSLGPLAPLRSQPSRDRPRNLALLRSTTLFYSQSRQGVGSGHFFSFYSFTLVLHLSSNMARPSPLSTTALDISHALTTPTTRPQAAADSVRLVTVNRRSHLRLVEEVRGDTVARTLWTPVMSSQASHSFHTL